MKISCITPTRDRAAFLACALRQFARQTHRDRELVVVDEATPGIDELVAQFPDVRVIQAAPGTTIGAKRNLACAAASGELVAHWDDDDWHAPDRLAYQAEAFRSSRVQVAGLRTLLFYDVATELGWMYSRRAARWIGGSTLIYRRAAWLAHPFEDLQVGEDGRFVAAADPDGVHEYARIDCHIGIIHPRNVSPKRPEGPHWQPLAATLLRYAMGTDVHELKRAAAR